ncbi:MAG: radical SAM protein [bacterium]
MRILLIQSYLGRLEPPVVPLGLLAIAASLKNHTARVFDPNVCDNPFKATTAILDEYRPEVIGLSLRNIDTTKYSDQFLYFEHFANYAAFLKRQYPTAALIVGGSGFSLFPEQIMQAVPEIDVGCYLEAEQTFSAYLAAGEADSAVKGLYLRGKQGDLLFTGMPDLLDFDQIPAPSWNALDLTPYLEHVQKASIGVETKRGCALSCAYCTYPALSGKEVRLKSPERVIEELRILKSRNVERVFFCDPVFNHPVEHAAEICRLLIEADFDIRWGAYHQDRFLTADYIELALRAGCDEFYMSPDAASAEGLKILGKATTTQSLERSLELIAQQGSAKASYNFFATVPATGWENTLAAIKFLRKAKQRLGSRFIRWKLSYIRIEPNTSLERYLDTPSGVRDLAKILPRKQGQLHRLFLRKSRSFWLNLVLFLHYYWGKNFGRKNLLRKGR